MNRPLAIAILAATGVIIALSQVSAAPSGRYELDLSGPGWTLRLDKAAEWRFDVAHLPPVDVAGLPVNPPSGGWASLANDPGTAVSVPGTVEEHFWGANGNPFGTAGDYRGVSWWSRTFTLDPALAGNRIVLRFAAVNLRAEVFVNERLVGYDTVGNTPFEVDITNAVRFLGDNMLDVRITDPVGDFTWEDNDLQRWGPNTVPAVHGFGGITGGVRLLVTDAVYIGDIHVRNTPKVTEADITAAIGNATGAAQRGRLTAVVHEWNHPYRVVWREARDLTVPPEGASVILHADARKAQPWTIRDPHLYTAVVTFEGVDGTIADTASRRFGFRWFTVKETDGDRRFYLNGRRVVVIAAMTRGFWPKNGMTPTPEMARRDIDRCLEFGFNTMLFHRAIGQPEILDLCDEAGILAYEEPGGFACMPEPTPQALQWRREKTRRMVVRDRSHPCLVIYNLFNEATHPPTPDDLADMRMIRDLDPGRILTFNSDRNRDLEYDERAVPDLYASHYLPGDDTLHDEWFDHHHWFGYPSYQDDSYENPRYYLRGVADHPTAIVRSDSLLRLDPLKIIFWGEEGQFGTMMRLGAIRSDILRAGGPTGFREQEHLIWYDYYERFLDESGFRACFPTVDDLVLSMGRNLHYHHARSIENIRMGNVTDGFNLNGWAAPVTSEDIADVYRHSTADTAILSRAMQPLYVAVKLRDKVMPCGFAPTADFFIVNEENIRGGHTLAVRLEDPAGGVAFERSCDVRVTGGETYGELLVEGVTLPAPDSPGRWWLRAELRKGDMVVAKGSDDIYAIDCSAGPGLPVRAAVVDTTGAINRFLSAVRGTTLPDFDPDGPDLDLIVLGPHDFRRVGGNTQGRYANAILDRVQSGATLVVLDQPEAWARKLNDLYASAGVDYIRDILWGTDGRYIAGRDPVLDGLPQGEAMHWEYQVFYRAPTRGIELGRHGVQTIVALACENRMDIVDALVRVPYGRGRVYLCTLPVYQWLDSDEPQAAAAKKLFLNLLEK